MVSYCFQDQEIDEVINEITGKHKGLVVVLVVPGNFKDSGYKTVAKNYESFGVVSCH